VSWLDLHMHSSFSLDAQYTPKELMSICLRDGVRTAALADHNTTQGVKEAQKWAEAMGISLIPAVELDCFYKEVNLHILGYWIDAEYAGFFQVEKSVLEQEQKAAEKKIELIAKLGIRVSPFAALRLAKKGVITGEIIAEVALQQEENKGNPLLAPYLPGGERSDNPYVNFYWDFCAPGKPAYVPIHYISLSEAVELIQNAGGIAVLAHPGINVKEDKVLLHDIIRQGICGIEAYSSYHTPMQTAFYREQAKELRVAVSCGSDFHGKIKPQISVGSVDCDAMESEILAGLVEKKKLSGE